MKGMGKNYTHHAYEQQRILNDKFPEAVIVSLFVSYEKKERNKRKMDIVEIEHLLKKKNANYSGKEIEEMLENSKLIEKFDEDGLTHYRLRRNS